MARAPLDIIQAMAVKNKCYKDANPANMTGVLFHSTAANNPYLKRYVDAPALVGVNQYNNTWNDYQPGGRTVCVHAFVGYDINNKIRVAQILPYNYACYGVGAGSKGSMNYNPNAKIQFEMCEDALTSKAFLDAMLDVACQYAAELCIKFGWDPLGKINGLPIITDHQEACSLGWGGNHGDILHWLKPHGYNLAYVKNKVEEIRKELSGVQVVVTPPATQPSDTGIFGVGAIVDFKGGPHYTSPNATSYTTTCKAGKAKVTNYSAGAKYPYHLIGSQANSGAENSNVYGWVSASDIKVESILPPVDAAAAEKLAWDFFSVKGLNDFAVAGVMGNIFAESGFVSNNLQNTFESKLGHTDASYTAAIDNGTYRYGTYTNARDSFTHDSAGYGIIQWTYWSRKQALYDYAKSVGKSISDITMQLEFAWKEMQGYTSMMTALKSATSVRAASDRVLFDFERPADQSEAVQVRRAGYGQVYYNKYAKKVTEGDDNVDQAEFNRMFDARLAELNAKTGSEWSKEAREWAEKTGLFTGDGKGNFMWQGLITREQAAQLFYNKFGKV